MYAIARVKKALNVWCWRVNFRRRDKLYAKQFFDLKHGGPKKALRAAVAWRDRSLARAGIFTYREYHQRKRSNNTSGAPGVHFIKSVRQPQGSWQARIKLWDGRKIHKSFSIRKFGRREAFRRAVAARAKMVQAVENRPYVYHPTAKRFAAKRRNASSGPPRTNGMRN